MTQGADGEFARFAPARGKLAVMAGGLVIFAGLAGWVIWITPAETWEGESAGIMWVALWAVILLCPVWAGDYVVRLARGTPTLVATADWLEVRGGFGAVARLRWDEISLIAPVEMGRKFWLGIYLHTPRETLGGLELVSRTVLAKSHAEGVPNLAFRAIQLATGPEVAAEALEAIRRNPAKAARAKGRGRR